MQICSMDDGNRTQALTYDTGSSLIPNKVKPDPTYILHVSYAEHQKFIHAAFLRSNRYVVGFDDEVLLQLPLQNPCFRPIGILFEFDSHVRLSVWE